MEDIKRQFKLNTSNKLSKRFLSGLSKYELEYDDFCKNWYYIGGSTGSHLKYFKLRCPNDELPEIKTNCICGHRIKTNCFVSNGEYVLSLGNCCIFRFVPKHYRTCEICFERHRNRKDNKCNACRYKFNIYRYIKKDVTLYF